MFCWTTVVSNIYFNAYIGFDIKYEALFTVRIFACKKFISKNAKRASQHIYHMICNEMDIGTVT